MDNIELTITVDHNLQIRVELDFYHLSHTCIIEPYDANADRFSDSIRHQLVCVCGQLAHKGNIEVSIPVYIERWTDGFAGMPQGFEYDMMHEKNHHFREFNGLDELTQCSSLYDYLVKVSNNIELHKNNANANDLQL